MAKEDIVMGLKNALERGENLDHASQTFINGGYSPKEVKEALKLLKSYKNKTLEIPKRILLTEKATVPPSAPSLSTKKIKELPRIEFKKAKGRRGWIKWAIMITGALLLGTVVALMFVL